MNLAWVNLLFTTEYIYYFDIAALCCLIVLGVAYFTRKNYANNANKMFKVLFVGILFATISDFSSAYISNHYYNVSPFITYLINIIFYISFSSMGPLFLLYVIFVVANRKPNRYEAIASISTFGIEFLAILTTPLTKFVFYVDENGIYQRAFFLPFLYTLSIFLLINAFLILIKNKKKVTKEQYFSILFFAFSMISTIIFQLFFPYMLLECFALSLFLFISYFNLQTPDYYINKYCGCLNSIAFLDYIEKKIENKHKFIFIALTFEDYQSLVQALGKTSELILSKKIGAYLIKKFNKNNVYGLRSGRFVIVIDHDDVVLNNIINNLNVYFEKSLKIDDINVQIKPYYSIFKYPEFSFDSDNLLDIVDYSLDISYVSANQSVNVMTNEIILKKNRENKIIQIMKNALKTNNGFSLNYQPIFNSKSNSFISLEALLRLKDDSFGPISPNEFIPLAEKNGMIIDISSHAFDKICKFISSNKDKLKGIEHVEVNLSPYDFVQSNLASRIIEIINKYKLNSDMFNFEITETADMKSMPLLKKNMLELVSFGCSFSLDDYGTGYSTTKYLVDLPFSIIKIDKSILFSAMEGKDGLVVLDYLVKTIRAVGKDIIVEGIENEKMGELLDTLGCNYRQGFYYSRPLSEKSLIDFLNNNN